jgi:hypothetical protein
LLNSTSKCNQLTGFPMTPDWAYEKLLLERRIKFLELVGRRFHLFGPTVGKDGILRQWSEEYCDVSSRETFVNSLIKIGTEKGNDHASGNSI